MSRFASVFFTLTLVFASPVTWALGLGSLISQSALNQPFKGEIQLYDTKVDELDSVQARLASPNEFTKVEIPRPFFLTQLQFEPRLNEAGEPVIQVSSREPIREPFMDFLVEVVWPQGRIVKEYTILLDPPRAGVETPRVVIKGQLISSEERTPPVATAPSEPVAEPSREPEGDFPIRYGPVKAGAGLWRVASAMAPPEASVQQVAMALYRSNHAAFGGGNINNLITGSNLVIPSAAELYALDPDEAQRQFSAALAGQSVPRDPLANKVALAEAEPEAEVAVKKKSEDPQRAEPAADALEEETRPQPASPPAEPRVAQTPDTTTPTPSPQVVEEAPAADPLTETSTPETTNASAVSEPERPAVESPDVLPETPEQKPATSAPPPEPVPDDATPPRQDTTGGEPEPEHAEEAAMRQRIQELEAQLNKLGTLLDERETPPAPQDNTLLTWSLAGGAGILVAALLGFLGFKRFSAGSQIAPADAAPPKDTEKAQKTSNNNAESEQDAVEASEPLEAFSFDLDQPPESDPPPETAPEPTPAPAITRPAPAITEEAPAPEPAPPAQPPQPVTAAEVIRKALSKADIYLSYGRHQDAQQTLLTALKTAPDSASLRFKLAEAYVDAGQTQDFEALKDEMRALGINEHKPDDWNRMLAMAGAGGIVAGAAPPPPPQSAPEVQAAPETPEEPVKPASASELDHFRLDFNNLDETDLKIAFPELDAAAPDSPPEPEPASPVAQDAPPRSAALDQVEIAPGDPDFEVSLPLEDLDQQLGDDVLGESAFVGLDSTVRDAPLDALHGEDDFDSVLKSTDKEAGLNAPASEPLTPLERATQAARNSRGVDPFEELIADELAGNIAEPAAQPSLNPAEEDTLPELDLPSLDQAPEPPVEHADPHQNLAADIEKFLAGDDADLDDTGLTTETGESSIGELKNLDLELDASSEADFHTTVLPSSAPPGQMPSSSIPELDLELEDLDALTPEQTSEPVVTPAPTPVLSAEPDDAPRRDSDDMAFEDMEPEPSPMYGDESLMAPDSGASDVLSSQWRMDSGLWDEVATKMDLAFAYIEMEDAEAARAILDEVVREGNDEQRADAQALLKKLDS